MDVWIVTLALFTTFILVQANTYFNLKQESKSKKNYTYHCGSLFLLGISLYIEFLFANFLIIIFMSLRCYVNT